MLTGTPEAPPQPSPQQRRRIGRRLTIALVAIAAVVGLAAAAFVFWTDSKIDRIAEEDLPSLTPLATSGTRTFLIVGTDDRSALPDDFEDVFGSFSGSRTDTIILVNFTPGEGAQLMSIPRDLKVDIPGVDGDGRPYGQNRINAAYVLGGPELLIATINQNLDIDVNHYLEIDLAGFARLVDAVDGVRVLFERAARDEKSGLDVAAGVQTLNGEEALAFVRSRMYQELRDGEWTTVGGNDIGRTRRQQRLLLALFDQVASKRSIFNLPSFAQTFADEVTVDAGLSLGAMIELGRAALEMSLGDIQTVTLPVMDERGDDGRAYVVPNARADKYLVAFRRGEPLP